MGRKPTVNHGPRIHPSMIPDILPLAFNVHKAPKVMKPGDKTIDLTDDMNPDSIENRDLCNLFKATDKIRQIILTVH